jgi:hypothetical protein
MLKSAFIFAFVLTLLTWGLVYLFMQKAPLDGPNTTVVFGLWLGLTLCGLWVKKRFSKEKKNG